MVYKRSDNGVGLEISKFEGRRHPVLFVRRKNEAIAVGYFKDDAGALMFTAALESLLDIERNDDGSIEQKGEQKNDIS